MGTSPHQTSAAGLPHAAHYLAARAQTPQQHPNQHLSLHYPAFQNNTQHGPQAFMPPAAFQHMRQVSSANATPSPVMSAQSLPPDHVSRIGTPHATQPSPSFVQAVQYAPSGYGVPYGPSSGGYNPSQMAPQPSPGSQWMQPPPFRQQIQPMMHPQMRMHPMAPRMTPEQYGQQAGLQNSGAPRPQPPAARQANPEQFVKNLAQFMHQRGQALNLSPAVGDRVINLMHLYGTVIKLGGSRKVTASGAWPAVAATMQFPQAQYPLAPQELREHYERNLALYEEAWLQSQQQQQQQRQRAMSNMQQMQPADGNPVQQQMSPTKPFDPRPQTQPMQYMVPQQHPVHPAQAHQMAAKPTFSPQNEPRHLSTNGHVTPEPPSKQPSAYPYQVPSRTDKFHSASPHSQQATIPAASPTPKNNDENIGSRGSPHALQVTPLTNPGQRPASPAQVNYSPRTRVLDTYGGIDVGALGHLGAELALLKPNVPSFVELGVINIHALTMSLQSGIHAEVRLALDTLATISVEPRFQLSLPRCEDLLETLIDCAEVQVELLAENAAEVSDVMLISPYEDVLRSSRMEIDMLQDVPPFGSLDHELDGAVERLICITTILRNLSFVELNQKPLADSIVVRSICTIIRYLGTRNMLLRTHGNTLDFMKDIIIYLSNLSQVIELPGKEEALSLLHFLLAFAPCPPPTNPGSDIVMFSPYQPSLHRYLPPAVDSLAKLLARDEPNRSLYRTLFLNDYTSSPPFDLLTRSFALAISPVPEFGKGNLIPLVEARKPYLVQGLLAAEILANLAPGSETGIARLWLSSADGFALSLLRLVCLLSTDRGTGPSRNQLAGRTRDLENQPYFPITHRGIAVLRRLAEKSKAPEDAKLNLPVGTRLKRDRLLGILLTPTIDGSMVKELCAYAELEG